jgi:hypothetical protein
MWHKARAQPSQGMACRPHHLGAIPKTVLSTCLAEEALKLSNAERRCREETWPLHQVACSAGLTSGPHTSNLRPQLPYSFCNYLGAPPDRKCEESEVLPPRVLPSPFVWSRERGEVLKAGGLPGLSGILGVAQVQKLCRNPFGFDRVFCALVWSSAKALPEFYEFRQRADNRVPLVYQGSSLSRYPQHYL